MGVYIWRVPLGLGLDLSVREFKVPCLQCIGCREAYARYWGIRCEKESLYHDQNCFLTLTVDEEHLEHVFPGRSLRYEPFQKFFRAFRKKLPSPVRFYMCGEYGEKLERPHFHSIIFGWSPSKDDRILYKTTSLGNLFISPLISSLWKFGYHTVADFSFYCGQYVAGYMSKKINGKMKGAWYGKLEPEFSQSSLKGCPSGKCPKPHGIGGCYYHEYKKDIFNAKDSITLRGGSKVPPGRYYDKLHEQYHPDHFAKLKIIRESPDPVRDFLSLPSNLKKREMIHRSRRKAGRNNF